MTIVPLGRHIFTLDTGWPAYLIDYKGRFCWRRLLPQVRFSRHGYTGDLDVVFWFWSLMLGYCYLGPRGRPWIEGCGN